MGGMRKSRKCAYASPPLNPYVWEGWFAFNETGTNDPITFSGTIASVQRDDTTVGAVPFYRITIEESVIPPLPADSRFVFTASVESDIPGGQLLDVFPPIELQLIGAALGVARFNQLDLVIADAGVPTNSINGPALPNTQRVSLSLISDDLGNTE